MISLRCLYFRRPLADAAARGRPMACCDSLERAIRNLDVRLRFTCNDVFSGLMRELEAVTTLWLQLRGVR